MNKKEHNLKGIKWKILKYENGSFRNEKGSLRNEKEMWLILWRNQTYLLNNKNYIGNLFMKSQLIWILNLKF